MAKRTPIDLVQVKLRLPERLRKRIETEATKRGHSLNRELVRRLEKSFANETAEGIVEKLDLILSKLEKANGT